LFHSFIYLVLIIYSLIEAVIYKDSAPAFVLVYIVTDFCWFPCLLAELKDTSIFPDLPGLIGYFGYSGMVHPQEPTALEIIKEMMPYGTLKEKSSFVRDKMLEKHPLIKWSCEAKKVGESSLSFSGEPS